MSARPARCLTPGSLLPGLRPQSTIISLGRLLDCVLLCQPRALLDRCVMHSNGVGSVRSFKNCSSPISTGPGSLRIRRLSHVRAAKGDAKGRQPWDIGRFARTVAFFNDLPGTPQQFLAALLSAPGKAVAQFLPNNTTQQANQSPVLTLLPALGALNGSAPSSNVVLVTGGTGGVGKRVVQRLLARGRVVRALVRDVPKAKQLLGNLAVAPGGCLQLVAADITQRATLTPDMFEGVRAVVSCTAVKVQPKEGDTPDRAKYYQGIKFNDPEIVENTPEAVEYKGLSNLLEVVADNLGYEQGKVLMSPDASLAARWGALDDVVMGGVSESSIVFSANAGESGPALLFRGMVSTDNSGGFISVRCKNFEPSLDLSAYEGICLRVKGTGMRYKLIIRTDTRWDGIGYCRSFDTKAGEWQDIYLPFDEFIPVFRAKTVRDGTQLDASSIASLQLMLSKFEYDGDLNPAFKAGYMELPITSIKAYLQQPVTPRFVHVSSAGVTRPNRPGIDVEQEPPAVKLNDALGGLLTYKLAGEDVVRSSGVPAAIVRPCALTEEPAGAPVQIDQGDTIKGKISREDVAELCVSLLEQPVATGVTFEIKSTIPFSQQWQPEAAQTGKRNWAAELSSANLHRGVTGRTINGVYTGKEPEDVALRQTAAV